MKRFLIIGLGPIGGILAAHLESIGQECYGVDIWDEHRNAIDKEGSTINGQEEHHSKITKTTKGSSRNSISLRFPEPARSPSSGSTGRPTSSPTPSTTATR